MKLRQRTAALALGGGGARGLSHLGAVDVIRSCGVRVEHFVGVSIGSLVGALCAGEEDSRRLYERVVNYLTSDGFQQMQSKLYQAAPKSEVSSNSGMFSWYETLKRFIGTRRKLIHVLRRPALLTRDIMQHVVDGLIPDIGIDESDVPLSIVAVDLYTGQPVVLEKGSLREAIIASTSIPGIFPPVPWDDMLLCDVGVLDPVPTRVAQRYASDLTIGVDVCSDISAKDRFSTALESFIRMNEIAQGLLRDYSVDSADIMIRPSVAHVPWFDFTDFDILIQEGNVAAEAAMQQLRHTAA